MLVLGSMLGMSAAELEAWARRGVSMGCRGKQFSPNSIGGEAAQVRSDWGLREDLDLVIRRSRGHLRDLHARSRHLNATASIWRWTKVIAGAASLCPNN